MQSGISPSQIFRTPKRRGGPKSRFCHCSPSLITCTLFEKQRNIQAVLLIRDLDNQPERRNGLEQARGDFQNDDLQIVIGVADPKREAWVLNGFISQNEGEHKICQEIHQEIGFDPCLEAQRLHGSSRRGDEQRRRDAKVVLEYLTQGNYEREKSCWCDTPLEILMERGQHTGLADYIAEVRERLLPILRNS